MKKSVFSKVIAAVAVVATISNLPILAVALIAAWTRAIRGTVSRLGDDLPEGVGSIVPWLSYMPVVVWEPKQLSLVNRAMHKWGKYGFGHGALVVLRDDSPITTAVHESVHIAHAYLVPWPILAAEWVLSWLVFSPFKSLYKKGWSWRVSTTEMVAYDLTSLEFDGLTAPVSHGLDDERPA